MAVHYEVEINVGRKHHIPLWYSLVENDNGDTVCVWESEIEARTFIQNDTRQLRLIRVDGARRELMGVA